MNIKKQNFIKLLDRFNKIVKESSSGYSYDVEIDESNLNEKFLKTISERMITRLGFIISDNLILPMTKTQKECKSIKQKAHILIADLNSFANK